MKKHSSCYWLRKLLMPLCAAILTAIFAASANAQQSITVSGVAVNQNFDSLGSSGTATLPSGWKIGTDWSSGTTSTTLAYGTTGTGAVTGTSGGGAINWANGVTASSTERALGFLTASAYTSPRSIIYAFVNNTGGTVTSIAISWNFEKYRSGSRAFDWTFFHGATSTAATADNAGNQAYAADANNSVIFNPPTSTAKSLTLTGLNIPNGSTYYIRWTCTGVGGSSNGQGLGIDDFSITLTSENPASLPAVTTFDPASGAAGTAVTIGGSNFSGVTNVAFNGVTASFSNVTDTSISATVPAGALSGPISVSTPSGLATSTNSFLVPTITVVLPATITEGASAQGEVRLNVAITNDLEISLATSSSNDLTVVTPVTVFGGETNKPIDISAPLDGVIDGSTNVTVTASASGFASSPGTISVVNVDQVKIPLTNFASNSYTQDFNSLTTTTVSNAISLTTGVQSSLGAVVSTNLNGWFAAKIAGSGGIANIVADNGAGTSGALYNYGSTNSPANIDRSLGTLATGSFTGAFGGLVVNSSSETINSIIINLTGKFWRSSTSAQNSLVFGYGKIDGTTFNNNNFLSVAGAGALPSANIVGPLPVASNGALDGNNPANQVSISNVSIPVVLAPGETMFFRWQDFNDAGNDAGLAVDNVSLTASTNAPLPVVGSVSIDPFTLSQASAMAASSVVSDGGASLTSRGFVYALTSASSNPVIGGSNVVVLTNDPPEVSAFTNTLTGLTAATSYSIRSFVVNGAGTNYSSAVQFSTLPVPPSFTGAYTQNFNGFTNMAELPLGWRALSTSNINTYAGNWNSTTANNGGFYGRTNIPGVLGYLHTSSTGILSNTLTLVNNSGGTLTNLFVSYVGEVNLTNNTRVPAWTVVVDGQTNASLAFSTASGSNEFKSAEITGLNITNGGNIVISWSSDRGTGTGSSRMIGMTGVRVATNAASAPSLSVSGTLTNFATTTGTASSSQSFSVSGSGLIGNVTATAPTGYEVSLDDSTFATSLTITPVDGLLASTPVYVRIAATTPVGSPSGNVVVSAVAAAVQSVAVSGTVSQAGESFANWSGGLSNTPSLQLIYAIGGATRPAATNGIAMSNAVTSSNLSITAVVRTNDPNLSVFGQSIVDLGPGTWATNDVSRITNGVDQTGVPSGNQRQIFSTPLGTDGKKFLRLQTTLSNQ